VGRLLVEGERAIHYEHQPRGPLTVVLSHGWGMGARVWDDTVTRLLDAGVGTLVVEHRGCGASDKDFQDVSIEALARDLVQVCDHLGLAHVVLNGWSLGGAVVVGAAAAFGRRLAGLVLTAAATPRYTQAPDFPFGGTAADVAATVGALRQGRVAFLTGLYQQGVFARDVGPAVKDHCVRIALQASPCADASLGALALIDQRAALAAVDAPALVFIGGRDGVVAPEIGAAAAGLLPRATRIDMPDCGHAPFLEDPETYHAALLRWIGTLEQRA
jgi:non-heme chloroperoxidase